MKQKTGPKFFQKLKRKDQFEIRSVEISPEKAVAGLAESVYEFGVAASRRQPTDVATIPTDYLKTLVSIATNTWRAKNKMMDSATGEVREDMKRVDRHIEAICRSLAEVGIVTRKAAQLAGFKESPLLQEPVAAALAYGFKVDSEKAYWLVYDFGGGTFDAAVIKSEEGTIHVAHHGGDNFLGGSNIDWAIVEKLVAPRLAKEFGLADFNRGNKKWKWAFDKLKYFTEIAKIDLSRNERATLECKFKDDDTGDRIEFECELTRNEVVNDRPTAVARASAIGTSSAGVLPIM